MDSPDLEYEFPCYNGMEAPEGIWSPKKFGEDAIYGGVLLKSTALNSNQSKDTILKMMLPRIQAHTRRRFIHASDFGGGVVGSGNSTPGGGGSRNRGYYVTLQMTDPR